MTAEYDNPHYYINREFTSLAFNERVLHLAKNPTIPLLERLRFLCICSGNLDEFFEIRVAGIKEQIALSTQARSIDGLTPTEVLEAISRKAHVISDELYHIFNQIILPALRKEDIYFLKPKEWNEELFLWSKHFFKNEIMPVVSPIALDLAHPFPKLFNKSLNFIIELEGKDAFDRNIEYAVVHAPKPLPRMVRLPSELSLNGGHYFVHLSTIMQAHVARLFPGMEIKGCFPFRLTRNSDLFLREEEIDDLAKALQHEIFSRHYGHVVRLEIDKHCPKYMVDFLLQKHHLQHEDVYYCDGPVNLNRYLNAINQIDRPDLNFPPLVVQYPSIINYKHSIFDVLDIQDILLHHPYQSFQVVVDFIKQAARDPNVVAIKQTLYRTTSDSLMVDALVEAARSGKEVTAVVELRARFDEESNLRLANRLHDAGVLVLYGVLGFKTHAKMSLVVRRSQGKLKRYAHLGTGNYHEQTAKRYTDIGLLTADQQIGSDVQLIFQQLTGLGKTIKLKALSHAPFTLQKTLMHCINTVKLAAQEKKTAEIFIKVNGLTDKIIIDALYEASQAGVKIRLFVRGVCCLKPGIPGISDNIRVISVVGQFLEHHRVYVFRADNEEQIYCASADLMERNLYNRIEVMFPILSSQAKERIRKEIIENYQNDKTCAWEMQADGTYIQLEGNQHNAQQTLVDTFYQHMDNAKQRTEH